MKNRTLGKDLQVSAVGLGCMGLSHAYGEPMERSEAVRFLRTAYEMGYTFFDTAEEIAALDHALDTLSMSEVYGGFRYIGRDK